MASTNAIVAQGLVRHFGKVEAVRGIDLKVEKGEIYGFLGPNGAGKSTVVRMLITLLMPTKGHAEVAGFDVVKHPREVLLRIGAALQEAALDNKQTGRELLRLQGRLFGMSVKDVDRRLVDLAKLVDIGDALDRLIGTYSGGMKRRLDLAAALIHNPEVLFLDEPTTGLDPISRNRVWEEVRRINRDLGVTIFLTTQYLEEADILCDRLGIINNGLLAAEGTPVELKRSIGSDLIIAEVEGDAAATQRAVEKVRAVKPIEKVESHENEITVSASNGAAAISSVALALNDAGVRVRTLTLRTPTLDDVFLQVTGGRLQRDAPVTKEESKPESKDGKKKDGKQRDGKNDIRNSDTGASTTFGPAW
ncbi:MAG: ATP-binding cassette domain-containing protein [SAR202 cluster bacterium]|nr:ATP-binding cassette domain-containing protein [SAR202 cluster bacterium]